jgi:hypothetical protein
MFPDALLSSRRTGEVTLNDLSKVADSLASAGSAATKIPAQKTAPTKILKCRLIIGRMAPAVQALLFQDTQSGPKMFRQFCAALR